MRRKKRKSSGTKKLHGAASPAPSSKIKHDPDESGSIALTVRERDVLYWVVRGKVNADISGILRAKPGTIRKHVEHIRRKFGSESRVGIIAAYWQEQIDKRDEEIADLKRKLQK
jgi:DNA-binding CsgD family transcriptional regulator